MESADTLASAYDRLLVTSQAIRAYKWEIVLDWGGGKDRDGSPLLGPDGKVRGRWREEETHEDCINASRHDR